MLFSQQQPVTEKESANNKGSSAYLRGLRLLQQQHGNSLKKNKPIKDSEDSITEKEKPKSSVSFIQQVATTIQNGVKAVIDTISGYINRLFS